MSFIFYSCLYLTQVRPLPPLKKPWSLLTKTLVAFFSASGTFLLYKVLVKAPIYEGPEVDLRGKTVVITEATSRMSGNLIRELAKRKATLVLASSSLDDCEATRSKLMRSVPGCEEVQIDCRRLDLDSTVSIRRFAGSILRDYPNGIDRLLIQPPGLLSGVIAGQRRLTHDAFEHQLGTNFFSFYLLTRLLLPAMIGQKRDTRVVFTIDTRAAGFAEAVADRDESGALNLPVDNWNWDEGYTPAGGYQRSQWALKLFADELANRTSGSGVFVLIADPAVNRTSSPIDSNHRRATTSPLQWIQTIAKSYFNFGYIIARVAPQRVTSTELMCTVAAVENLDANTTTASANVYKHLQICPSTNEQTGADILAARQLLWQLGERWTRIDTNPEPVPLPRCKVPQTN